MQLVYYLNLAHFNSHLKIFALEVISEGFENKNYIIKVPHR